MSCASLLTIVLAQTLSIGAWAATQIHNIKLAPTTGSVYGEAMETASEFAVVIVVAVIASIFIKPKKREAKTAPCAKTSVSVTPSVAQPLEGWRKTMALGPTAGRVVAGPRKALGSPTSVSSLDSDKSWRAKMCSATVVSSANDFSKIRLEQFISVNGLDDGCVTMLHQLSSSQAEWVMDQEFFVTVDSAKGTASAKVVHMVIRAKQKKAFFQEAYPTAADVAKRLADFVNINSIDDRCIKALESLPVAELRRTMDREFVVKVDPSKGTASAKVVGRILKARNA